MADNIPDNSDEIGHLNSEDEDKAPLRAVNGETGDLDAIAKREEALKVKKKVGDENDNITGQNGTIGLSDDEEEKDLHHFSPREEETDSDEEE